MACSYVGKFGTKGSDKGQLNNPHALDVDKNGYIFVANSYNNQVSAFEKLETSLIVLAASKIKIQKFIARKFIPHME